MNLQGKVGLVIGATGNLGSVLVENMTNRGCQVVAVARRHEPLVQLASRLARPPLLVASDFTIETDVQRCFREITEAMPRVDFVVYSAGIEPDPDVPLSQYPLDAWRNTFDTYTTGFFLCFREAIKLLPSGAHILAVSSAATRFPSDRLPPGIHVGHYAAAKAALDEFCKWARREAHERNILLSRIAPGALDTPFHREAPPHRRPPAALPVQAVVELILQAFADNTEIDRELVATP